MRENPHSLFFLFMWLAALVCLLPIGGHAEEGAIRVSGKEVAVSVMQPGSWLSGNGDDRLLLVPYSLAGYDFLETEREEASVHVSAPAETDYYLLCAAEAAVPPGAQRIGTVQCRIRGAETEIGIYKRRIHAGETHDIRLSPQILTVASPSIRLNRPVACLSAKGGLIDLDTLKEGRLLFLKDKKTAVSSGIDPVLRNLVYVKSFADRLQVDSLHSYLPISYYVITATEMPHEKRAGVLQTDSGLFHVYRMEHPGGGRWIGVPEKWKRHSLIAAEDMRISGIPPVQGMPLLRTINPHKNYITDPAIELLDDGTYIAACKSRFDGVNSVVRILRSTDKGKNWEYLNELENVGFFSFFRVGQALYIMGTKGGFNQLIIRRSVDGGRHWTVPADSLTGLLKAEESYHSASVSTVIHNGRVWRAFEDNIPLGKRFFRAFVMSAPLDSDLLRADSWQYSEALPYRSDWLGDSVQFKGWFEGNVVVTPDGEIANMLRVETWKYDEMAALIRYDKEMNPVFRPEKDLIPFPGGEKKFTVRFDPVSHKYWSLSNMIFKEDHGKEHGGLLRNRVVLTYSDDLIRWVVKDTVLSDPDPHFHGYQYVDWRVDGEDIILVSRTAAAVKQGLPTRQHDANFFTFHRIRNFRNNEHD